MRPGTMPCAPPCPCSPYSHFLHHTCAHYYTSYHLLDPSSWVPALCQVSYAHLTQFSKELCCCPILQWRKLRKSTVHGNILKILDLNSLLTSELFIFRVDCLCWFASGCIPLVHHSLYIETVLSIGFCDTTFLLTSLAAAQLLWGVWLTLLHLWIIGTPQGPVPSHYPCPYDFTP